MGERTVPPCPTASGRALPRFPALDGLRALAVAAVFTYHAGVPWAQGGFLGVDAFVAISRFLITALLLTEWRRAPAGGPTPPWSTGTVTGPPTPSSSPTTAPTWPRDVTVFVELILASL